MSLPRGIWFEADRARYRIRRYRNGRAWYQYRPTLEEALTAFAEMSAMVAKIPKLRRGERMAGPVPVSSFAGMMQAVQLAAR